MDLGREELGKRGGRFRKSGRTPNREALKSRVLLCPVPLSFRKLPKNPKIGDPI